MTGLLPRRGRRNGEFVGPQKLVRGDAVWITYTRRPARRAVVLNDSKGKVKVRLLTGPNEPRLPDCEISRERICYRVD